MIKWSLFIILEKFDRVSKENHLLTVSDVIHFVIDGIHNSMKI